MLIMLFSVVTVTAVFLVLVFSFFVGWSRWSMVFVLVGKLMREMVSPNVGVSLVMILMSGLLVSNVLGNIPLAAIPTLFYSSTLTLSMLFWLPLMGCVIVSQLKEFLAHMLPYGSPVGLMLFLPLVEIFSQIIRPFTLMIRLSTNLSAGHIMMYMFSYFSLLSAVLSPLIYVVLVLLFVLEMCISVLQAYIFASLMSLYINETA